MQLRHHSQDHNKSHLPDEMGTLVPYEICYFLTVSMPCMSHTVKVEER